MVDTSVNMLRSPLYTACPRSLVHSYTPTNVLKMDKTLRYTVGHIRFFNVPYYSMFNKSCPFLYSAKLVKDGQDFLDIHGWSRSEKISGMFFEVLSILI